MSLVEEAYLRAVDAMTPAEKFARMHALLNWTRDLYARQLRENLGDVSEERIKMGGRPAAVRVRHQDARSD